MKEIKLTQGLFAQVDDEDYEYLNQFRWHVSRQGDCYYAARRTQIKYKQTKHYMHIQIMGCKMIDHRDHNGLNCQKYNMRKCTKQQNCMNRGPNKIGCSKYKGVWFHKKLNKWASSIKHNGKRIYLGLFINEKDAAVCYDNKAVELFGEFAYLNFKL